MTSSLTILGIESSCDETAAAVVRDGQKVLSSIVASQTEVHAVFGGVVPEVASREHLRMVAPLVSAALAEAETPLSELDAIAVTQGPGLIGALLVGVSYAKGLALASGLPLVPVDHVHAHIHGAMLGLQEDGGAAYPSLALVVSGGHTNLYRMEGPTSFHLLAATIDDACGECFDKVAKLLGLPYPGGPEIEALARKGDPGRFPMPTMVQEKSRLEFSYSGLKTHMAGLIRKGAAGNGDDQSLYDLCAGFQKEALGQIIRKLRVALSRHPDTRSILIAGGVAANEQFRGMASALGVRTLFPHPRHCADNAAMIAALGYHEFLREPQRANVSWDAYSRYDFSRWREDKRG